VTAAGPSCGYNRRVVPSENLSRKQVDFILRRAAEIDTRMAAAQDRTVEDGLSVGDLMRLGEEAGLGRDSMAQALTEVQRGAPLEPAERGPLVRALGGSRIIVSRLVPAPLEIARRAVDRFLRDQLMTVRRHHGDRIEWERAQGIWPGLIRSLDFSKRYSFGLVSRVETIVSEEGDDTSVTFNIDLSEMRRERLAHMGLRSAMAFALVGLGGAAMLPGFGVPDLVALAGGGVAAGGIFALERRRYLESRNRVALAPERFLDLLTYRVRRRAPAAPLSSDEEL
jgi:hypothetical protein